MQRINGTKPKDKSWEEWWREERIKAFHALKFPVITGHHLNDQVETWIWSCIHGQPKLIPYRNVNVIRPFLLTSKTEIVKWADKRNVKFIEDESNYDIRFQRNLIRHNLMPEILKINIGIEKVIKKKVLKQYNDNPDNDDALIHALRKTKEQHIESLRKLDEKRKLSNL